MMPPTRPVVSGSGSGSKAAAVSSSGGTGDSILEGEELGRIFILCFSEYLFFSHHENLV
jgi:hypothetical protein